MYALVGLALLLVLQTREGGGAAGGGGAATSVVVTGHALEAGHIIVFGDLSERTLSRSSGIDTLISHVADAVGRRVLVPLPEGSPLQAGELGTAGPPAGRRRVTVVVDRRRLPAGAVSGTDVDVVAALDGSEPSGAGPSAAGPSGSGTQRIEVVARARLVEVGVNPAGASTAPGGAPRSSPAGPGTFTDAAAVLLECDSGSVLRIVWAETYAHSLTLLDAGGDTAPPPPAEGPPTAPPRARA